MCDIALERCAVVPTATLPTALSSAALQYGGHEIVWMSTVYILCIRLYLNITINYQVVLWLYRKVGRTGSGGAHGSGELPLAPPSGTRPGRLAAPSRHPPRRESASRAPTRPSEWARRAPSRPLESPPVGPSRPCVGPTKCPLGPKPPRLGHARGATRPLLWPTCPLLWPTRTCSRCALHFAACVLRCACSMICDTALPNPKHMAAGPSQPCC